MTDTPRTAILTRMVLPDHVCPYGERALALLEEAGYAVDDRHLTSREAVDAFKAEHSLTTTPFIQIGDREFRSSDELEEYLGEHAA